MIDLNVPNVITIALISVATLALVKTAVKMAGINTNLV